MNELLILDVVAWFCFFKILKKAWNYIWTALIEAIAYFSQLDYAFYWPQDIDLLKLLAVFYKASIKIALAQNSA